MLKRFDIENRQGTHTYVTNEHCDQVWFEIVIDRYTPSWESLIEEHVQICYLERTIEITAPITGQMLYTRCTDIVRSNLKLPMPMAAITSELFVLEDGWSFKNEESRNMIRFSTIIDGDDSYSHCHWVL